MLSVRAEADLKQKLGYELAKEITELSRSPWHDQRNAFFKGNGIAKMKDSAKLLVFYAPPEGELRIELPPKPRKLDAVLLKDGAGTAGKCVVTVCAPGKTIDGVMSITLPEWACVRLLYDGSNWLLI